MRCLCREDTAFKRQHVLLCYSRERVCAIFDILSCVFIAKHFFLETTMAMRVF